MLGNLLLFFGGDRFRGSPLLLEVEFMQKPLVFQCVMRCLQLFCLKDRIPFLIVAVFDAFRVDFTTVYLIGQCCFQQYLDLHTLNRQIIAFRSGKIFRPLPIDQRICNHSNDACACHDQQGADLCFPQQDQAQGEQDDSHPVQLGKGQVGKALCGTAEEGHQQDRHACGSN